MKSGLKILFFVTLALSIVSCSTVRLRYDAKFKSANEKSGEFVYEKSYPVGALQTWCIITGIVYGGACWGYLFVPYGNHERMIERDARVKIGSLVGSTSLDLFDTNITRQNWSKEDEYHNITIDGVILEGSFSSKEGTKSPNSNLNSNSKMKSTEKSKDVPKGFLK